MREFFGSDAPFTINCSVSSVCSVHISSFIRRSKTSLGIIGNSPEGFGRHWFIPAKH